MKTTIILHNKNTGANEIYKEATYTKLDGIYGYLCIDGFDVKFFYSSENEVRMDTLDYFTVSYEFTKMDEIK